MTRPEEIAENFYAEARRYLQGEEDVSYEKGIPYLKEAADLGLQIHQLAEHENLSREEFTLLKEATEYNTLCWTRKIAGASLPSFSQDWKLQNIPVAPSNIFPKGIPPHADFYRKVWDLQYAAAYLKKHPELDIALRKSNQETFGH